MNRHAQTDDAFDTMKRLMENYLSFYRSYHQKELILVFIFHKVWEKLNRTSGFRNVSVWDRSWVVAKHSAIPDHRYRGFGKECERLQGEVETLSRQRPLL